MPGMRRNWLSMSKRRRAQRDESGAVAIIVAVLIVIVLGIAALGVDLGNAMNRKQLTQNSADFAAIAGANGLPATTTSTVQLVADYLNDNQPASDSSTAECNPDAGATITATMLQDGKDYNGEVTFPAGTTRIRVVSPGSRVQFGLGNVLGFDDTCVQSVAEARISSGKYGMAPFYATDACDQGPQVLKSDAGGPSIPFSVPTLHLDAETNTSVLSTTDPNPNPGQIPVAASGDPDGPAIILSGTNLAATDIDLVGFFSSDQTAPHTMTPTSQSTGSLTVNVPNAVASYQDVWWIRVHNKNTNTWSARSQARPLLVGEVTLSCKPDSSSGNFGSIDIPAGGTDLDDLESNIRDGLREPTTLMPWPGVLPSDNTCNTHPDGVTSTDTLSKENTNCVESVTGLKAGPAYDGFLGTQGKGLLKDTTPACLTVGRPPRGPLNENSDVLSCFLKDNTLKLSDAVSYSGSESLFTQDLWSSPRFLLVPKLDHDPNGEKWMPITGFVPAFITDQPTGASRQNPLVTGATDNGLVVENPDKLRAIRVFFFDIDALPPPPDGVDLQDYIGSGRKVVTLIN
jgi:Flp pilus assembly protein TadG